MHFKNLKEIKDDSWLDLQQFKNEYQKVEVIEFKNNVLNDIPNPRVSVRMTTYQHEPYIREAIESVLKQKTDFPYEIIIGDDESTDGTREICIEYAKKHPEKIRLFLHKRENNISVLNRPSHLFQYYYNSFHLRAPFVAGCSGDDYWTDDNKLQIQYEYLTENPNISYCYHNFSFAYEDGIIKNFHAKDKAKIQTILGKNVFDHIPKQFLNILQEDSYLKFVWSLIGESKYLNSVNTSVIRILPNSMYTSLDREQKYKYRIEFWKNMNLVFRNAKNKKIRYITLRKMNKVIYNYHIKNIKKGKIRSIYFFIFDFSKFNLKGIL